MTTNTRETVFTIACIVLALAASVVAGWLTSGSRFFNTPRQIIDFLVVGFGAALIYATMARRGFGTALLMFVLFYLIRVAMFPPIRATTAIGAAIYTVPVGSAFLVSSALFRALRRIPIGKFILMGLLVGAGYAVMFVIYWRYLQRDFIARAMWLQALVGLRLGGIIGFGFELVELPGRIFPRREET